MNEKMDNLGNILSAKIEHDGKLVANRARSVPLSNKSQGTFCLEADPSVLIL